MRLSFDEESWRLERIPRREGPTPRLSQLIQAKRAVRSEVFQPTVPSFRISPRKHRST